ncbi:MAG: hypothetical protein COC23_02735 [Hyphomicrobiales bacterium]|nr:MAG: hypothetical protein COC23_02735 [Hyphomicrobiales bacterium]
MNFHEVYNANRHEINSHIIFDDFSTVRAPAFAHRSPCVAGTEVKAIDQTALNQKSLLSGTLPTARKLPWLGDYPHR